MRWLILIVLLSACGGGSKPPMEPDDPSAKAQADAILDGGAE